MTKQGAHGTLFRYVVEYTDDDPGFGVAHWHTWAYSMEHAIPSSPTLTTASPRCASRERASRSPSQLAHCIGGAFMRKKAIPPCAASMGCLCAGHARGTRQRGVRHVRAIRGRAATRTRNRRHRRSPDAPVSKPSVSCWDVRENPVSIQTGPVSVSKKFDEKMAGFGDGPTVIEPSAAVGGLTSSGVRKRIASNRPGHGNDGRHAADGRRRSGGVAIEIDVQKDSRSRTGRTHRQHRCHQQHSHSLFHIRFLCS